MVGNRDAVAMRLLIFDHAAYLPRGDSPQRHYELARNMVENGVKTTLVGSGFDHRSRRRITFRWFQLWRGQEVDGVRYVWLRLPHYSSFAMRAVNMCLYPVVGFLCFLSGYLGRPDCVLGSSPHMFAPLLGRLVSRLANARFVLEIRDLWPDSLIDVLGVKESSLPVRVMRKLERYLFQSADSVVSVLPGITRYIAEKGFKLKGDVSWIPNGVSLSSVPCASCDHVPKKVVYFGAVGPANGLDKLLDIWKHVESVSPVAALDIIGGGPSLSALKLLADDLQLQRVDFLGFMKSKDDLYAVAASGAAFVIYIPPRSIYKYGVGANKIAEYLALGRPMIFIGEGLSDTLRGHSFVLALDEKLAEREMAMRIVEFLENCELSAGKEGLSARKTAEAEYVYENLAKRLFDICFR